MYLTHFTKTNEALLSIINNGLVFFPNERRVFTSLTAFAGKGYSEPQCRGMVCFTDTTLEHSGKHRARYGDYGVAIKHGAAVSNGATKVIYLSEGSPVFNAFSELFAALIPEVPSFGDPAVDEWIRTLAATRPAFAESVGSKAYPYLLTLHDYMQTEADVAESEWRVVRPFSFHWTEGMDINTVRQLCLAVAMRGIVPTIYLTPNDVEFIVCPRHECAEIAQHLPEAWKEIPIQGV